VPDLREEAVDELEVAAGDAGDGGDGFGVGEVDRVVARHPSPRCPNAVSECVTLSGE
jgi:hypothetical protein